MVTSSLTKLLMIPSARATKTVQQDVAIAITGTIRATTEETLPRTRFQISAVIS